MVLDKQFVFIIGAPRSGTTWLQAMLGAHPTVCTTAELMLFNFYTAPWAKAWDEQIALQAYGGALGLPMLWSEDEFYGFLQEFLRRAYERMLLNKPEATIVLDKHPGYSECVEHMNRLIPEAKFIHIIRDGRDVVTSLLAASQGWGKPWAASNVQQAARHWNTSVQHALKGRQYGQRYYEVRYEDLQLKGPEVLKSVFTFMGVPVSLKHTTSIFQEHQFENMKERRTGAGGALLPDGFFRKGEIGDWQGSLTTQQRYTLHTVAGDRLSELGYADDSWWLTYPYQRFTCPARDKTQRKVALIRGIKNILGAKWTERLQRLRHSGKRTGTATLAQSERL